MINYSLEIEKYRPKVIKTLLIGEAPPLNGKTFFYLPKQINFMNSIENNTSLPATIFNCYFGRGQCFKVCNINNSAKQVS